MRSRSLANRALVEVGEGVQVVRPVALFEKVVRLFVFQHLEKHHHRGGLGLLVGQVGLQPGEFLLPDLQAEGLPGQVGPQDPGVKRNVIPPEFGLGRVAGEKLLHRESAGATHVDLPAVEGWAVVAQPFSGFSVYGTDEGHLSSLGKDLKMLYN